MAIARLIACRLNVFDVTAHLGLLPEDGPINLRAEDDVDAAFSVALGHKSRLHFRAVDFEREKDESIKLCTVEIVEILGVDHASPKKVRKP